jgi:RES domain-containing protein
MKVWRISNHADLSGRGGLRAAGRWHSAGRPIVYLAEHPASALLEVLVHLDIGDVSALPTGYQLLEVMTAARVRALGLPAHALEATWRDDPGGTRAIGDAWLASGRSALLRVPSALVPNVANYLFNPLHADASQLSIKSVARYPFDNRLFKVIDGGGKAGR